MTDRARIRLVRTSQKQEKRTAATYQGKVNPQSGAGWAVKNDVTAGEFLIENKFTINKRSITLKASDLEMLSKNAILSGRTPLLQFDLNNRRYLVLREDDGIERLGIGQ